MARSPGTPGEWYIVQIGMDHLHSSQEIHAIYSRAIARGSLQCIVPSLHRIVKVDSTYLVARTYSLRLPVPIGSVDKEPNGID